MKIILWYTNSIALRRGMNKSSEKLTQGSVLEEYGTPLDQQLLRDLSSSLWGYELGSAADKLETCQKNAFPLVVIVELSCPEISYNLNSNQALDCEIFKILWNTEIVFLHTVTTINLSLHYAWFPSLRLDHIVFWKASVQNSITSANGRCMWNWTKLHLLKRYTCTTKGFGIWHFCYFTS